MHDAPGTYKKKTKLNMNDMNKNITITKIYMGRFTIKLVQNFF